MHPIPKGSMLEAITQKVDSSAVRHPNGEKVAGSFADRPESHIFSKEVYVLTWLPFAQIV